MHVQPLDHATGKQTHAGKVIEDGHVAVAETFEAETSAWLLIPSAQPTP
jgi:hypothetical protein